MSAISPTILWAVFGILLLIIEMFTLSFGVLFFGVAALVVAGLKLLGLANFAVELLLFAGIGLSGTLTLRRQVQRALGNSRGHAIDQHQVLTATADIPAHGTAKVEYQGTLWDAHNEDERPIRRGEKARVLRTEGIKLVVRPEL